MKYFFILRRVVQRSQIVTREIIYRIKELVNEFLLRVLGYIEVTLSKVKVHFYGCFFLIKLCFKFLVF